MVYYEATPIICPYCGSVLGEYETVIGNDNLKGGDIAICGECAGVGVHVTPTMVRTLTTWEEKSMLKDPRIIELRAQILDEWMNIESSSGEESSSVE